MKLIDYYNNNKDNFTEEKVVCYFENKKKSKIRFAIYKDSKENKIYLYYDYYKQFCLDCETDDIPYYFKNIEVIPENFIITTTENWIKLKKKSIKDNLDKESKTYQDLMKFFINNSGKLAYSKGKQEKGLFVGITSTDEDYYYLILNKKDDEVNYLFSSCCGSLNFVDENEYTKNDYDLIDFLKQKKSDIIKHINEFNDDVLITPLVLYKDRKKPHYRQYKNDALQITFNHCNKIFDKSSKCIEVLQDILAKIDNPQINNCIIKLLNTYITEYGIYYKPLDKKLKNYYKETFIKKLNDIFESHIKYIKDEKIISYVTNICKTLNKVFLN